MNSGISRREFGLVLGVGAAPAREIALANEHLSLNLDLGGARVRSRRLAERHTGESLDLPAELFLLEFEGGSKASSADLAIRTAVKKGDACELLFEAAAPERLQVRVRFELEPGKQYLRKRLWARLAGGSPRRLMRVDLENWRGVRRAWSSMTADPLPYGSHPIFCDRWWAGVEFVAAFNGYSGEGFTLRSRPGGIRIGQEWVALRSTVAGTAAGQTAREAFLRYLEDVRIRKPRFVSCYNSWWTLPKVVTQRDNQTLIEELKARLRDRHGEFFDIVATDMGWSSPRSIWRIDRGIMPRGFEDLRRTVESAGGKLGLWMSPSEQYPPVCDYDWAEKSGYTVIRGERYRGSGSIPALSLADPRYRTETIESLRDLIRNSGMAHIKYDGFLAVEHRGHHDLLPGDDSVEPLAGHALELLEASTKEKPDLVTEPTFLNSHVNYISPWILMYSDTIWGNTSDCPLGIGPAPEYRESHTNAREWLIFSSFNEIWAPQNGLQYFDIVHVDGRGGFANHAAMAIGRGRFFLPAYVNPKVMTDPDWEVLAGLLAWARRNQDVLVNTTAITSRIELGEPYVYGHWLGERGIVVVRNPSNQTNEFALDLRRSGAPESLRDAVCYTQYPYRRGLAAGVSGRSTVRLRLAPWELLFLEVTPRSRLRETVVLGGRWYRDAVAPDPGVRELRVLLPGGGEKIIPVNSPAAAAPAGSITAQSVRPLPREERLRYRRLSRPPFLFHYPMEPDSQALARLRREEEAKVEEETLESCAFEVECSVNVPDDASGGQVLLLVEFPGKRNYPSQCTAQVNGNSVPLRTSDSSDRVGYHVSNGPWKHMAEVESKWCWYMCDLRPGRARVKFSGKAGHARPRLAAWLWVDRDLAARKARLDPDAGQPAMPQVQPELLREGIRLA